MSIFSIFTGKPAKDAAAQNAGLYGNYKTESLGYLDQGLNNATGAINQGLESLSNLGNKYGGATGLYLDALGVNGADGTGRAQNAFTAGPGYQWMVDQALDAVNRTADARGMLRSGNTQAAVVDRASGLAGQEYNNWLSNLSGFVNPELSAATSGAGLGQSLADLYIRDAAARTGVAGNVAGGLASNNNMVANAETQGSGNLWNLGLNLLKLGTDAYGYSTGKKAVA